jgi:hypothetical protein
MAIFISIYGYLHLSTYIYMFILTCIGIYNYTYSCMYVCRYINLLTRVSTIDDVYLKKDYNKGVIKSNPKQKCRPAKGISKRVNRLIIKDTDITLIRKQE